MWLVAAVSMAGTALAEWSEFKLEKFGFAVTLPDKPREINQKVGAVDLHSFVVGNEAAFCNVSVSDYATAIDDSLLAQTRDIYIQRMFGKMTATARRTLSRGEVKLPAIEFDMESPSLVVRSIIAIDGDRVYQVSSGIPPVDGNRDSMERCVRSFKLLPNK